ncbi:MAG TPA: MFS transporter [Dehalococcoidia bacterium]
MDYDLQDDVQLLKNDKFRRLLQARFAGQTAQNAMLYALLILLVTESGSSIHSTLLIVALTIPSIVLGIPGGAIADLLPRRFTLTLGYLARACVAAALFYYSGDLFYIYVFVLIHSTIGQFFGPAEAATVPAIVRRDQLSTANSLMMLSLMLGQIVGMVVIAPILIKIISPSSVFLVAAAGFVVATYIVGWLASDFSRAQDEKPPSIGFIEAMREGFQILRTNRHAYLSIVYLTTGLSLSKVLIILMPKYTRDVLDIAPEDTVFVVAPAAIGAGVGLLIVPLLIRFFGAWRVAAGAFFIFVLGLAGLGLVVLVRDFVQNNFDFGISFLEDNFSLASVITVTMMLAIPLGLSFTILNVATRVVMNEQAPQEAQGRIFAMQMALGDFLSLLPLLIVGIVADVVGVRATLLASAVSALGVAGYLTFSSRFGPVEPPPPASAEVSPVRPAPEPGT